MITIVDKQCALSGLFCHLLGGRMMRYEVVVKPLHYLILINQVNDHRSHSQIIIIVLYQVLIACYINSFNQCFLSTDYFAKSMAITGLVN